MNIKVTKLTDVDLLRKANGFTTHKESRMSLATAYKTLHSPARTQLFTIEFYEIPLFVASQLVRSKVGIEWWQRSKRTDRGGECFDAVLDNICDRLDSELDSVENGDYDTTDDTLRKSISEITDLRHRFDRYAPTDLMCLVNAEAIINMSHKRLCCKASVDTREIWRKAVELIEECDPDLARLCVRPCVCQGYCREAKTCGYINTDAYRKERELYKSLFNN